MTGCYVNTFLSPLSLERETECLKKVAQNDKEAKDELILHNMRLVAHVTKKYAVSEDEMEELISIWYSRVECHIRLIGSPSDTNCSVIIR